MLRFSSGLTRWFLPSVMAKMLIAFWAWAAKRLLLLLDHAAGVGERERADFAGAAGVARGVAVGHRVDVGVGLAEHFVERGGHHAPRGVTRLQRRVAGELVSPAARARPSRKSRSSSWTNRRNGPLSVEA